MKKNYLTILLLCFGITATAQNDFAQWAHVIQGGLNTSINNVVTDGEYAYINGTYAGNSTEFLGTPLPYGLSTNILVGKIDTDGNALWMNTITGGSIDAFYDLRLDNEGNLIATGWSSSQDDLVLNDDEVLLAGDGIWTTKGLVAKFSGETGELIWFRSWASGLYGSANPIRLTTDADDNIYVAGYYTSDFSIDEVDFTFNKTMGEDVFLIKFNPEGEAIWGNTIETEDTGGFSRTKSITANSEGVYHIFEYNQPLNINDETVPYSGTSYWLCIAKSDFETGEVTDYTYFGSPTGFQTVNQLTTDNDDNLLMTGYFTNNTGFEIDGITPEGYGNEDAFVAKMTPEFELEWLKTIGGTFSDRGFNVFVRPTGEILVGGGYGSSSVLNYEGEEIISETTTYSSVSSAFQLYLDPEGNYVTHQALWGYSVETSISNNSTVVLNDNSIITGGRFVGTAQLVEVEFDYTDHNKGFVMKWQMGFSPLVQEIVVTTENDVPAEIVGVGNTLQLVATINPIEANQEVIWSVEEGAENGSVDENGLVSSIAFGTVTVRATSVEDDTMYDEIDVLVVDPCAGITAPEGDATQTLILGQTLADTDVEGENLQWYSDEALTTAIPSSTVIVSGTTYYVTQTVGECVSGALAVTINLTDPCEGVLAPQGESVQALQEGQTLADVTVSGENLQWYSDAALTTAIPSSTVAVNGTTYYVTQTIGECVSDALAVTINLVTSVNDITQSEIALYPNPVQNILNLSSAKTISDVSVYSLLGELVYSKSINKMQAQLDLSSLAQGVYFVKVEGDSKTFKIVKK